MTVVDNRLPLPSRNEPLDYTPQPCSGVTLPVAGATPRRCPRKRLTSSALVWQELLHQVARLIRQVRNPDTIQVILQIRPACVPRF